MSDPSPSSASAATSVARSPISPAEAWAPLPAAEWNEAAAKHLLRRATWSATREEVAQALAAGLPATLDRLFPATPTSLAKPTLVETYETEAPQRAAQLKGRPEMERRELQRQLRERGQQALAELTVRWLEFARAPENAAREKWMFFLSDVYVVSAEKVANPSLIFEHHDLLRRHSLGSAPALTKEMSRSGALIQYLDLQQSRREAPNENFARELFELFTLGQSHYTEGDIKEAARAFTGYRQREGDFLFSAKAHDNGKKTVFGQTGKFTGDDVIDQIYQQTAAATFLPEEAIRYYLSAEPLDSAYYEGLGAIWKSSAFDLRSLAQTLFGSRLFFHPSFRGNFIKSPVQFYLGLLQDLDLSVTPFPRPVLGALRGMGQRVYYPPNVRGWVGGRAWINSATLSARRQLVQSLFQPFNEAKLNADDLRAVEAARARGLTRFTVDDHALQTWSQTGLRSLPARWTEDFLPLPTSDAFRGELAKFLTAPVNPKRPLERVRTGLTVLLQSPDYQLC